MKQLNPGRAYFEPLRNVALYLLSEAERLDEQAREAAREAARMREHSNSVMAAWQRLVKRPEEETR